MIAKQLFLTKKENESEYAKMAALRGCHLGAVLFGDGHSPDFKSELSFSSREKDECFASAFVFRLFLPDAGKSVTDFFQSVTHDGCSFSSGC